MRLKISTPNLTPIVSIFFKVSIFWNSLKLFSRLYLLFNIFIKNILLSSNLLKLILYSNNMLFSNFYENLPATLSFLAEQILQLMSIQINRQKSSPNSFYLSLSHTHIVNFLFLSWSRCRFSYKIPLLHQYSPYKTLLLHA